MKQILAGLLLSATIFGPTFAAELSFSSVISNVTVYLRGARVTRVASGEVASGSHVVIVDDLPGKIVANSVRVEGMLQGVSPAELDIGSIDVRQQYVSGKDRSLERQKIELAIEKFSDDIALLSHEIANANTRRTMLQTMAAPRRAPGTENKGAISAEALKSLLDVAGSQFTVLSQITENARIRQREIVGKIAELQNELNALAPRQQLKTAVAIHLNSDSDTKVEFRIHYQVNAAGWAPIYDAKLVLGKAGKDSKVIVNRRASIRQSTSETWQDVRLKLSTARPNSSTQVPSLSPYILREQPKYLEKREREKRLSGILNSAQAPVADGEIALARAVKPKRRAKFAQAQVAFAGFLAEYKISGKVSVLNAGEKKDVLIAATELGAEVEVLSVPKLNPAAFLTAKFIITGNSPWLPGEVALSRGGVFLGKGKLPMLNPGELHSLGFGQDDLIKIERTKIVEKKGEDGFISKVNLAVRKFVTTIKNSHDFSMPVIIQDQLPYGTHEDIVVEMLAGSSKPTKIDVGNKRGLLTWENNLGAGEEITIELGYKVTWPRDMVITPVN